MGHIRLGRLPLRQNWSDVAASLEMSGADARIVSSATAHAAKHALSMAAGDPDVAYPFWLLTRLAYSSRTPNGFAEFLSQLGVSRSPESALDFIGDLVKHLEQRRSRSPGHDVFGEFSADAFQETIGELVLAGSESLFGTTMDDIRLAFRRASPARVYGEVSRAFCGNFFARLLRHFVSFELSFHIGEGRTFADPWEAEAFNQSLASYARDVSKIVQEFSRGWYSKALWQAGEISTDDAQRFLYIAFRKFRQQLEKEVQERQPGGP